MPTRRNRTYKHNGSNKFFKDGNLPNLISCRANKTPLYENMQHEWAMKCWIFQYPKRNVSCLCRIFSDLPVFNEGREGQLEVVFCTGNESWNLLLLSNWPNWSGVWLTFDFLLFSGRPNYTEINCWIWISPKLNLIEDWKQFYTLNSLICKKAMLHSVALLF